MSAANPTPAEYKAILEKELADLKAGRQTQYTQRRIQTLEQRLAHMYVPDEERKSIFLDYKPSDRAPMYGSRDEDGM